MSQKDDLVLPSSVGNQSIFQEMLLESVSPDDHVMRDFVAQVLGHVSRRFFVDVDKPSFFEQTDGVYASKVNLRSGFLAGIFAATRLADSLLAWDAPRLASWSDERVRRLFLAAVVLYQYTKTNSVYEYLQTLGFAAAVVPVSLDDLAFRSVFLSLSMDLGLDLFLEPIGSLDVVLSDLMILTLSIPRADVSYLNSLISDDHRSAYGLIFHLSRFVDEFVYLSPSARSVSSSEVISATWAFIASDGLNGGLIARLGYHHIAENRGLLLNFMNAAVVDSLSIEGIRFPLLYASDGVVYLERVGFAPDPDLAGIIDAVVRSIRQSVADRILETGVGVQLNKDGLRVTDTFDDIFELGEVLENSYLLLSQIRTNAPKYMEFLAESGWPHTEDLPVYPLAKDDVRLRWLAEWASLIEAQYLRRFSDGLEGFIDFVFEAWGLSDLREAFQDLRAYGQRGTGILHRWYWAAAYVLERQELSFDEIRDWLKELSRQLSRRLPSDLPLTARVNQAAWLDLRHFVALSLSVNGEKLGGIVWGDDLAKYIQAKGKRGKPLCAICGSHYTVRPQIASAMPFQTWVYTARLELNARYNQRSICSLCASEQLLRQLFVKAESLPTGGDAEAQRLRYLFLYPSSFFSPELLRVVDSLYARLQALRLSDKFFLRFLREQSSIDELALWQGLQNFILKADDAEEEKFKKLLRYSSGGHSAFFMLAFRSLESSELESWILPSFFAFILAISFDLRIVVTDSGLPLFSDVSESSDLLWFDGVHSSIQGLTGASRLNASALLPGFVKFMVAIVAHMDSYYVPPKENLGRFGNLARFLLDSPIGLFSLLKHQERDGKMVGREKVHRYVGYADLLAGEGNSEMSYARTIVELYRRFYRARSMRNTNSIIRPFAVATDALLSADARIFSTEEALVEMVYGEIYRFMERVQKNQAEGRFPKGSTFEERQAAMRAFAQYLVKDLYMAVFRADPAALRGKQLNLIRSACEVIYRELQALEFDKFREEEEDALVELGDEDLDDDSDSEFGV